MSVSEPRRACVAGSGYARSAGEERLCRRPRASQWRANGGAAAAARPRQQRRRRRRQREQQQREQRRQAADGSSLSPGDRIAVAGLGAPGAQRTWRRCGRFDPSRGRYALHSTTRTRRCCSSPALEACAAKRRRMAATSPMCSMAALRAEQDLSRVQRRRDGYPTHGKGHGSVQHATV